MTPLSNFIWLCNNCKTTNKGQPCASCGMPVNLLEQPCTHSNGYDMACDECDRSGFRFPGWNDGEQIEDNLVDEGSLDGPGFRCERLKGKTVSEEDWREQHKEHLPIAGVFSKVYNETQPPSYRLYKLTCTCGASLQCMEELEGVD